MILLLLLGALGLAVDLGAFIICVLVIAGLISLITHGHWIIALILLLLLL